jgi:hypothetical protein
MAGSLGYTMIDGSNESICENYLSINITNNNDVLHKYNTLFESYKKMIIPSDSDSIEDIKNKFDISSINFLENVLKIKKEIKKLHEELKFTLDKMGEVYNEINELEKIKQTYIDANKLLDKYLVFSMKRENDTSEKTQRDLIDNIKLKDERINFINSILYDKKIILEENENKKINLIEKIKLLKTIICTNDVTTTISNPVTCFICAENPIECCLNPCGHTFCNSCSARITNQRCYMCRKTIISTTKLFFDNGIIED